MLFRSDATVTFDHVSFRYPGAEDDVLHDISFTDAVLLNEKIVREDVYTSIHIEEYETESRDTKLGPEEITRDIPNVSEDALKDLDERGIIRVGAEVKSGDILVGKVTPSLAIDCNSDKSLSFN